MNTFAAIAGYIGAGAFTVLVILLLVAPRAQAVARLLTAASAMSALWFLLQAGYYDFAKDQALSVIWLQFLEIARDLLWLLFLARILAGVGDEGYRRRVVSGLVALCGLIAAAALLTAFPLEIARAFDLGADEVRKGYLLCALGIALGGLAFTEQLFRNTTRESRWSLKHMCFGIGMIFAYDFYLYADALLFTRLDAVVWSGRGIVNALAVPMIAISAARHRDWSMNIFVSRRVVFHGVAVLAAGVYLMAMALAGYYVQMFGGEWGRALKTTFFSAAILVLLTLFFSAQLRSRVRRFLAKHFYRNKYEYGEEWLRFTQRLAQTKLDPESLNRTILNAVSDIVDSPGGVIWCRIPSGHFAVAATFGAYDRFQLDLAASDPFVGDLQSSSAVRNLTDEGEMESDRGSRLPEWLLELPRVALVVPIVHGDELLAFVVLARPRSGEALGWEDIDLLGTVGRQVASYLALVRATDALSEARQFETFNRLSAFLVHDLKNVVAQLSLIESNARKHRDNPEFVEDAFNTVGDAVGKMNRMLANLRQTQTDAGTTEAVDLCEIARNAVSRKSDAAPAPVYTGPEAGVPVRAARDQLLSVIEHLLQNGIEATSANGTVEVSLDIDGRNATMKIRDNGCGMDREFVNNRLFKPFDTTKGKAGMGIGAYESRHVVSSMGGELQVDSEVGRGTTFTIVLPLIAGGTEPGPVATAAGGG